MKVKIDEKTCKEIAEEIVRGLRAGEPTKPEWVKYLHRNFNCGSKKEWARIQAEGKPERFTDEQWNWLENQIRSHSESEEDSIQHIRGWAVRIRELESGYRDRLQRECERDYTRSCGRDVAGDGDGKSSSEDDDGEEDS